MRNKLLISLVVFVSSFFRTKPKSDDLKKLDFSSSTQKMGLSFTDKIRNTFRHKWINKS